jgi:type I restriction enzyme S subunit
MATNQGCKTATPPPFIDSRYLYWYLLSAKSDMESRASGTTFKEISSKRFGETVLRWPAFDEQLRIVDILEDHCSRLDASTASLDVAARRVRSLAASTVSSSIEGPTVRLGELACESGYGTSTKCSIDGQGLPVARIPNLVGGAIDMTNEKRAVDASVDLTNLLLKEGDLLIVRTNGSRDLIGRSAVVDHDLGVAFASYLIRYRLDLERVRPAWVSTMLGAPPMRKALEQMAASSAGQYNLGLTKLNSLQIPCPSLAVQDSALQRVTEANSSSSRIRVAIDESRIRAASLRRSVLSAAFSGRLASSGSADELREIA